MDGERQFFDTNVLFLGLLFLGQGVLIWALLRQAALFVDSALDTMSKLAQIVSIHQKSRTAAEAVEQTLVLDSNLRALDRAERAADAADAAKKEPPKPRPVGVKDEMGRVVRFITPIDEKHLVNIPKDRLVYE